MGITFLSDTGFPQADGCVKQREGDEALPMLNAEDRSIHNWQRRETEGCSHQAWALPSSQTSRALFLSLPQTTASAEGAQNNMEQPRAERELVCCSPTVEGFLHGHLLHGDVTVSFRTLVPYWMLWSCLGDVLSWRTADQGSFAGALAQKPSAAKHKIWLLRLSKGTDPRGMSPYGPLQVGAD